ncbi:hypothetical protein ACFPRA_22670 [Sporosarcina soli]|uniref:DUF4829 domain-containing protein n=1 Tax=Sporosarcina soli TaxID=334736 RepID=A0ABW0TQB8_9BACL
MSKKSIWGFLLLLAMTVLMAACTSENEADANEKADEKLKSYVDVFEETDAIAHDFMVVKIEQNYPEVLKYMSSKGTEELTDKVGDLLDIHRLPDGFAELNDVYELRRYDNLYAENKEEIVYRYSRYNDRNVLVNDWIVLQQNEEGVWKVRSYFDIRPEALDDSNSEKGMVLHELPDKE